VDHSSQHEERVSAQKGKFLPQSNEDENRIANKPDQEAEKTTESRNEVSTLECSSLAILAFMYTL
jgi:nuclear factor erythroid 2-related factor 1/3